jgi:hypothetical protein
MSLLLYRTLGVPRSRLRFARRLFLNTLRLLLLAADKMASLLLDLAGNVLRGALDLILVHANTRIAINDEMETRPAD